VYHQINRRLPGIQVRVGGGDAKKFLASKNTKKNMRVFRKAAGCGGMCADGRGGKKRERSEPSALFWTPACLCRTGQTAGSRRTRPPATQSRSSLPPVTPRPPFPPATHHTKKNIQDPPSRDKIRASLAAFDSNRNGVLERREFVDFIGNVVTLGPQAFLKNVVVNTAVLPQAAGAFKALDKHLPAVMATIGPFAKLAGLDDKYLAPLLGVAYKTVRGLIPV
jgi:hypothetical protein